MPWSGWLLEDRIGQVVPFVDLIQEHLVGSASLVFLLPFVKSLTMLVQSLGTIVAT